MKTYLILPVVFFCFNCAPAGDEQAAQAAPASLTPARDFHGGQETEIKDLLKCYEQALDNSDLDGVARLYTDDAVALPPETPTAVGIQAVKEFYSATFQAISLNISFQIAEIQLLSPEWAFVRTSSAGVIDILANGAEAPSSNHELFVMHKIGRQWKIARYSFSSVLPAAK
jgi:uncharacterized protein (TIGR02246 family)